jgi:SSS family solute:Na+ symporter
VTGPLIALLVFLALQLAIGIVVSKKVASEADYLVGGRRLGYTLATFSVFATWFGAETIIGSAGEVRENGVSLASAEPFGYALCLIVMGAFIARPLWNRGLTTLADLYRARFGVMTERVAAVILIPGSVLWAAAQIRAFGQVVASASPTVPVEWAIIGAAVFVVAYTTFGGLLADAVTDVLQGVILALGLVILLVAVVLAVGGPGDAFAIIRDSGRVQLAPSAAGPWIETIEAWAIPVIGSLMASEVIGRVIGSKSGTVAQRSTLAAGGLYLAIGCIPVLVALLADPFVGTLTDAEQILPATAQSLLPPILYAVFVGGLVSAILSTVDSTLLVASGLLSHNLLAPILRIDDDARKLRLARGGVLGFGLLATVLALNSSGVLALVEQASAFGSAGIFVTSLFALFTTWGDARAAIATLATGIGVYAGALTMDSSTPFLLSLAASLITWTIGCALARKAR